MHTPVSLRVIMIFYCSLFTKQKARHQVSQRGHRKGSGGGFKPLKPAHVG